MIKNREHPFLVACFLLLFISSTSAIGASFERGYSCYQEKDFKCALDNFNSLARDGNGNAIGNLALMYRDGHGVKQDYVKAVQYMKDAVSKGDINSLISLGLAYRRGEGVEKDLVQSSIQFLLAAHMGDELGQNQIGLHYFAGIGMERNYDLARHWLVKSCQQRNDNSCQVLNSLIEFDSDKATLNMMGDMVKSSLGL